MKQVEKKDNIKECFKYFSDMISNLESKKNFVICLIISVAVLLSQNAISFLLNYKEITSFDQAEYNQTLYLLENKVITPDGINFDAVNKDYNLDIQHYYIDNEEFMEVSLSKKTNKISDIIITANVSSADYKIRSITNSFKSIWHYEFTSKMLYLFVIVFIPFALAIFVMLIEALLLLVICVILFIILKVRKFRHSDD